MARDEAYTAYVPGTSISSMWTATTLDIAGVQVAEYDLVDDSRSISLLYLRLSAVQTLPCTDCPLGTDLPTQTLTRDQLTQVLAALITQFTADSTGSSVSFQ